MGILPKPNVTITISNRTIIRVIALIVASWLFLSFLSRVSHALTLIFISFFFALALNPAVSWIAVRLQNRSRVRATGVAYLAVLAVLVAFAILVIPPLVSQTIDFINDIPETINSFQTQDSALARTVRRYNIDEQLSELSKDFTLRIGDLREPVLSTAGRIGNVLISIITVLVLTFMMLVEGPVWLERFWAAQPNKRRERHKMLANKMYRVVTGYVNGQLLIALIGGAFAMVALFIASTVFDVSINVVAMAGIIAMLSLIPMFGNLIGATVVAILCLFSSVPLAITMAVFFLIYQQVENATIQPYIQARQNELTPMLVFIAALLGIGLGGILGAFLAIPVAGCIKILVEDYYSRHKLKPEAAEA